MTEITADDLTTRTRSALRRLVDVIGHKRVAARYNVHRNTVGNWLTCTNPDEKTARHIIEWSERLCDVA